jgi:hypothetical protein
MAMDEISLALFFDPELANPEGFRAPAEALGGADDRGAARGWQISKSHHGFRRVPSAPLAK